MSWLGRLFRREPEPPKVQDRRWMNEDWRVGDLAECICGNWEFPQPEDPMSGDILRVTSIGDGPTPDGRLLITALGFEGKPPAIVGRRLPFARSGRGTSPRMLSSPRRLSGCV